MAAKNSKSFTNTVKQYGGQLMSFVKARVKKTADAEDILQEVWYQFSRLTNIDQLENAGAWLYAVTRNKITDNYRKKSTESLDQLTEQVEEETFVLEKFLVADDSHNPESKMFRDLVWDELYKALEELPEKQSSVFILNEIEQMTLQQIADLQQENLKTIISRKGYAVKHLRLRLQELYEELKH